MLRRRHCVADNNNQTSSTVASHTVAEKDTEYLSAGELQSIPSLTNGYYSWCFSWAILAAATARVHGVMVSLCICLALLLLFRSSQHLRNRGAVPGAFFNTYYGLPEAYLSAVVCILWFSWTETGMTEPLATPGNGVFAVAFLSPIIQYSLVSGVEYSLNSPSRNEPRRSYQVSPHLRHSSCFFFTALVALATVAGVVSMYRSTQDARDDAQESKTSVVFSTLWAPLVAFGLLLDWPGHTGYYKWFKDSGLGLSTRRGLGFNSVKPYGLFTMPTLTETQFNFTSTGLAAALGLSSLLGEGHCMLRLCLYGTLFVIWMVYNSQLGQETSIGQHSAVPVPHILFYLAMAFGGDGAWGTAFIKIHMMSLYFAPGLLKLLSAWLQKRVWWRAPTMQYYLFAALFSRPSDEKHVDSLVKAIIRRPWLCTFLACNGLAFECIFPVVLFNATASRLLAFVALGFHFGVFVMQGLTPKPL